MNTNYLYIGLGILPLAPITLLVLTVKAVFEAMTVRDQQKILTYITETSLQIYDREYKAAYATKVLNSITPELYNELRDRLRTEITSLCAKMHHENTRRVSMGKMVALVITKHVSEIWEYRKAFSDLQARLVTIQQNVDLEFPNLRLSDSEVQLHNRPVPSVQNSHAVGSGLNKGEVFDNEPAKFTIYAKDHEGHILTQGGHNFKVRSKLPTNGSRQKFRQIQTTSENLRATNTLPKGGYFGTHSH